MRRPIPRWSRETKVSIAEQVHNLFSDYRDDKNTVYAASMKLELGGNDDRCEIAGWGVFPKLDQRLVLTDPNGAGRLELAAPAVVLSRRQQAALDLPSRPQTLAA